MYQSSLENMQKCYERFVKSREWPERERIDVIDIGGANVNGSYADVFSGHEFTYRAADINPDANVDIVLDDPYKLPFSDDSIDIVVSGQAFEHVEFFWLLFEEMVRILKPDGMIFLIAPSAGAIHRYPVDCYRFYPDAYHALARYCKCELLNVIHDQRGPWKDLVGVFTKRHFTQAEFTSENRIWEPNRYEAVTNPVGTNIRHSDPSVEILKGAEHYLKVLEKLHQELEPKQYLEIGIRHGKSLALAKCHAIGIDPQPEIASELPDTHEVYFETSDNFFEFHAEKALIKESVDFAFIDGMHLFEFALRDFINVEKYSTPYAMVIIDDVSPNHYVQAQRQRESAVWTGDIWKLAYCLSEIRKDLQLTYLDTYPTGLLIVTGLKSNNNILNEQYNPIVRKYKEMELDGKILNDVLNRINSIPPFEGHYWTWLKTFVKEVKEAKPNHQIQVASQLNRVLAKSVKEHV